MPDLTKGVRAAIKAFGTQTALAVALKIERSAVSQWKRVPVNPNNRVLEIEKASKGAVTRYQMRPDIYGYQPDARQDAA